jgi:hypothetical protein
MAEDLVTVYRFVGSAEAHLWQERLHTSGIKAVVVNEIETGAAPAGYELQVKAKEVLKAQQILKSLKKTIKPIRASAWLIFVFGIIFFVTGTIFLISRGNSAGTAMGIVSLCFGVSLLLISLRVIFRNK